ncbi:erythromycin esterase family protein [Halorussus amylolyticus]|uniref:erythromycin esterase family protein n=1 Tax=Halorussus amylolyticus TaxID=1126242 RepID=UPI00104BB047|nr:erythromycin esterase family protein [Halorussus amylolyticus]
MSELRDRTSWEEPNDVEVAAAGIRSTATELTSPADLDDLVADLGDDRYVLLGEASHGTSEFYRWRARLTARLVEERGFDFVAVEGDWTDCYAVNRYVRGLPDSGETIRGVLEAFDRWPAWMWANWEMVEFLEWLDLHNEQRPRDERVGFYGMDVYSLFESMDAVVDYLEDVDFEAAEEAENAYRCFEPYGEDAQEYARALRMVPETCEDEVVDILSRLRASTPKYDTDDEEDYFNAEQNALVARNAERYYREMVSGDTDSWNVRDRHMFETLERLTDHHGPNAKGIVWAHNTHVGDARATDMEERGRLNVGQLVREHHSGDVSLVGFGSHRGSVIAADSWNAPMAELPVPPAQAGSYEHAFHRAGDRDWLLQMDDLDAETALAEPRGHRAIGVVYHPQRESGNYVPTVLPQRYDAFLHIDETQALHPLDVHVDRQAVPELYPWGL